MGDPGAAETEAYPKDITKIMRLCFLVRQLNSGGMQKQLVNLLNGLSKKAVFDISVICFYSGGQFSEAVTNISGVKLISLNKRGRFDSLFFILRLIREIRKARPDILHSYLNLPNDLSVLLKPLLPSTRIVWGIRSAYMDLDQYDYLERLLYRMERKLSSRADLIIANSNAAQNYAVECGFPSEKIKVIYNGIDSGEFKPLPEDGAQLRREWGLKPEHIAIGIVGRIDPMKDYETFFRAARMLSQTQDNVRYVCVGGGSEEYILNMKGLCDSLGLTDLTVWTGPQSNMPAVYSALDILNSSSYGESFANVIGEAMACETPCVVTDVGDSANIVGDTGIVVPPKDPEALASGWQALLTSDRKSLGCTARARIVECFSVEKMVERTEAALCLLG